MIASIRVIDLAVSWCSTACHPAARAASMFA
jgi:hypothetical protein